jgi:putative transposase
MDKEANVGWSRGRSVAELYNTVRPHSRLGNLPPAVFAQFSAPGMQRDGALRTMEGSAPRPVASPGHKGSNQPRTLPITG